MLTTHRVLAFGVIAACAGGAFAGGILYWRGRGAGALTTQLLALAQTLLVAQVGVGLLLLSEGRRAGDQLHYVYGTLSLGVALVPWFYAPDEPARRLVWFAGCIALAAALAIRALTTGG